MAEYGPNLYGDDLTVYGARPASDLSANPMVAKVYYHGGVELSWRYPNVTIDSFRIVRNQTGHPTHESDGVVLLEQSVFPEGSSSSSLVDGTDHPLDLGRYAYYAAFAKLSGAWRRVGKTQVLVPGRPTNTRINRGTVEDPIYIGTEYPMQEVLLDLVPRVYTNAKKDAIGPHDTSSILRDFLTALTLTTEDIRTLADLVLPSASKANLPPGLLKHTMLQHGLPELTQIPVVNQKRLLREAYSVAKYRGTSRGVSNYIESLTGWAPQVSISPNLLRYADSSNFATGVGEWGIDFGGTYNLLTANQQDAETDTTGFDAWNTGTIESSSTYAFTGTKSIKATATQSAVAYGLSTSTGKTTISADTVYSASARVRTAGASLDSIAISIRWFTSGDVHLSTTTGAAVTVSSGWTRLYVTGTAPSTAAKADIVITPQVTTGVVAGDIFYADAFELSKGGVIRVDCSTWQPPVAANYPLTSACRVSGTEGRVEIPAGGWESPTSPGFFPVQPSTTYTFSAYFRPTTDGTTSVSKTVLMRARGFTRANDSGHQSEWPDLGVQDYLLGEGEWRLDDPFYWPRVGASTSFVLPSGTPSWVRKSLTFTTGPSDNFVSLSLEWTSASHDKWAFTGAMLEPGNTATMYRYPNSALVTVSPTRTNLVSNPCFTAGSTTGWTKGSATTASSTDVPPGVLVANSLSVQGASPWTATTTLPVVTTDVETTIVASAYVRGDTGSSVTLGLDAGALDAVESTVEFSPTAVAIEAVDISGGTMVVHTPTPHGFSVGQSVVLSGQPIEGTVTVSRVASETTFMVPTELTNTTLNPQDCVNLTASASTPSWARTSVVLTVPAGTWTPTLYLKSSSTSAIKIAGVLAEKGAVLPGEYFDGNSPGQYGTEWRGTSGDSVSDMYHGWIVMAAVLNQTLEDYTPRNTGVQVASLKGTVIADRPTQH